MENKKTHDTLQAEIRNEEPTFKKLTVPKLITLGYGYNLNLKKHLGKINIINWLKLPFWNQTVSLTPHSQNLHSRHQHHHRGPQKNQRKAESTDAPSVPSPTYLTPTAFSMKYLNSGTTSFAL